jgi:hypothetical protein
MGNPENYDYATQDPLFADDIIFGGWGDDALHGGAGDDAISGAEALGEAYIELFEPYTTPSGTRTGDFVSSDYSRPFNPGNTLAFEARRGGEFAAYDEYDPWQKIMLNSGEYFMNFDHLDLGAPTVDGTPTDGNDVVFGDLGNDWLVGGTGKDHLYGGYGFDLLQADDNLMTNGGQNDTYDTDPSYEDIAYGGAGRDYIIGNTGGDRLIDWAGEFNSYIVPYAPFGAFSISRALQPQLMEYLYDLSRNDGADPTRSSDTGTDADRNGEPEGELGLVMQKDPGWHDQTGAPDDPQAGNIPGGKRDVLRSATFNSGTMEAFAVDSGVWEVQNNELSVAAASLGGDAAAVFHVGDQLPTYFEIVATINIVKPTGGWKANAYVIFDYQNEYDFKFAGINVSIDKIQMGHRDETGWHVDVQDNLRAKPGIDYNMLVAINGVTVTVVLDGKGFFSYTYEPRLIDGYAYGLNAGWVGVGSDNSQGTFDNITVQVLPPEITFKGTEAFPDTHTGIGFDPTSGEWNVSGGRYDGASVRGESAISLVNLGLVNGLEVASILQLNTTLNTDGAGGVVFDYYGPTNFKFAAISVESSQIIIGHHTDKRGWSYDTMVEMDIEAGKDCDMAVSLKGTTVSVSVKTAGSPNWQVIVGYVFNAVVVDGEFGLLTKDGNSSFDEVTVKTDDPAFIGSEGASALMAATEPMDPVRPENALTYDALSPTVEEAIERWTEALGVDNDLQAVTFQIVNFDDLTLGMAVGDTILIDADAAGFGWFVDATPKDDDEFMLQPGTSELFAVDSSDALGKIDLLTVVMHELGHILGLEDVDLRDYPGGVMVSDLSPSTRRTDTEIQAHPAPASLPLDSIIDPLPNDPSVGYNPKSPKKKP